MAKDKKKICPLIWAKGFSDFSFCPEQQCAWWVTKERCCSIRLIADDLNHIAKKLWQ